MSNKYSFNSAEEQEAHFSITKNVQKRINEELMRDNKKKVVIKQRSLKERKWN